MSTQLQEGGELSRSILVLGEESSSRRGLTDLLSEDGFEALPCEDMTQALESLPLASAMVVEQSLPHERLAEFLARVMRKDPRIPVFVITPYCDTEEKLIRDDLTPSACFPMPLVYDDLIAALRKSAIRLSPPTIVDQDDELITPQLVATLDVSGPRYTSYPTAPVFSQDFESQDYEAALSAAGLRPGLISLYAHLPFCQSMCEYCACNVMVRRDVKRAAGPYVKSLLAEARMISRLLGEQRRVVELHLGGGTPNYMPRAQVERLVQGLESHFPFVSGASRAIEVDPRHFEPDQLDWLASLGFSRVSLGIQDVEEKVQEAIGRRQSIEDTERTIMAAREAGFDSVNMDLVYGLPAQTRETFSRTLKRVIALRPDRLALFSFAYVPGQKPHQRKLDMSLAPKGEMKARLLLDAVELLTSAGYMQVGMDHFALPGDPLARSFLDGSLHRNFQGYVPGPSVELIGLGPTSIGDVGGAYIQNRKGLSEWNAEVDKGVLPVERGWKRSFDDEVRRAVIQSLMCRFELRFSDLSESFGIQHDSYFESSLSDLSKLACQGLIELRDDAVIVTRLGRFFVRNVAMTYDAYLPGMKHAFSRTI